MGKCMGSLRHVQSYANMVKHVKVKEIPKTMIKEVLLIPDTMLEIEEDYRSEESKKAFQSCNALMNLVKEIKPVAKDFVVDERLIGLNLKDYSWEHGLMRQFKCRRVCIAYANIKSLNEELLVKLGGVRYGLIVKELMGCEVEMEMAEIQQEDDSSVDDLIMGNADEGKNQWSGSMAGRESPCAQEKVPPVFGSKSHGGNDSQHGAPSRDSRRIMSLDS
ncbi:hypothetical protein LXL04_008103 [Taraxacum kok-saghyz]